MNDKIKQVDLLSWLGFRYPFHFAVAKPLGGLFGAFIVIFALALFVVLGLSIIMFFSTVFSGDHLGARNYALTLAAILAAPFVVWRAFVGQKMADIAEHGLITDRISKAVEQLGAEKTVRRHLTSKKGKKLYELKPNEKINNKRPVITETSEPNLEVRLGGIYALERIAQDSERDHISVMEILCAYVRTNTSNDDSTYSANYLSPRTDIDAAMSVIGRRSIGRIMFERDCARNSHAFPFSIDLRNTNLTGILLHDARLVHANLVDTNLSYSSLRRSRLVGSRMMRTKIDHTSVGNVDFNLAIVFEVDFTETEDISNSQIHDMFGNSTTILPSYSALPDWSTWFADNETSNEVWQGKKSAAGL